MKYEINILYISYISHDFLLSLSVAHEYTVEFFRDFMMCDISTEGIRGRCVFIRQESRTLMGFAKTLKKNAIVSVFYFFGKIYLFFIKISYLCLPTMGLVLLL